MNSKPSAKIVFSFTVGIFLIFSPAAFAEAAAGGVSVGGAYIPGVGTGPTVSPPVEKPTEMKKKKVISLKRAGDLIDQLVELPDGGVTVEEGSSVSFEVFEEWRYVETLKLKVSGNCQVWVNGSRKRAEKIDEFYVVFVNEAMNEIEIKADAKSQVEIEEISAKCSRTRVEVFEPKRAVELNLPARQKGLWLAREARQCVQKLQPHVDPRNEYVRYLLPIREAATRAYAVALKEEDLSEETRKSLIALAKQIFCAEPMLMSLMGRDDESESNVASELTEIALEIERRLKWNH